MTLYLLLAYLKPSKSLDNDGGDDGRQVFRISHIPLSLQYLDDTERQLVLEFMVVEMISAVSKPCSIYMAALYKANKEEENSSLMGGKLKSNSQVNYIGQSRRRRAFCDW